MSTHEKINAGVLHVLFTLFIYFTISYRYSGETIGKAEARWKSKVKACAARTNNVVSRSVLHNGNIVLFSC
jgi:hypothetical protein